MLLNINDMNTITISLPRQVARQVDVETRKKGFATRSEFIRTLLRNYFVRNAREELVFQNLNPNL